MNLTLPFTEEESQNAHRLWGANCGPQSLAAATGYTLPVAVDAIPQFRKRRYTNPTMMAEALRFLEVRHVVSKNLVVRAVPLNGIARVQWRGSWLDSGVPPFVAYGYTHWVASRDDHVFCTAVHQFGWIPVERWQEAIAALCQRERYAGWHVTHQYLFL